MNMSVGSFCGRYGAIELHCDAGGYLHAHLVSYYCFVDLAGLFPCLLAVSCLLLLWAALVRDPA